MRSIVYYALFYAAWILLHFGSSHFYAHYCTPLTIRGLFMSPFQAMTPQCVGARWMVNNGGNVIAIMWTSLGLCIASFITQPLRGVKKP